MHQTRSEIIQKLPLPRKGTKYVAVAIRNRYNSVPLVVAIRDMLNLASTSKEVKKMIHNKAVKVNGKISKNLNDPLNLFSILDIGKKYMLTILPTNRFSLEETKNETRNLKITGKRVVRNGALQYSLHDGTSISSKQSFLVGDTLVLNHENKVLKHITFEKGKDVFVLFGSNVGKIGKIKEISDNGIVLKLEDKEFVADNRQVILI